jgi:hypothetical protein
MMEPAMMEPGMMEPAMMMASGKKCFEGGSL